MPCGAQVMHEVPLSMSCQTIKLFPQIVLSLIDLPHLVLALEVSFTYLGRKAPHSGFSSIFFLCHDCLDK